MSGAVGTTYRCSCAPATASAARSSGLIQGAIDLHCHVYTPAADALARQQAAFAGAQVEFAREYGSDSAAPTGRMFAAVMPKFLDVAERLGDMARMGVARQALSPSPSQYYYWSPPDVAETLAALQNDAIAQLCDRYPANFIGLGMVSLQHPDLAVRQLKQLAQRGFRGVEISARIGSSELSDAAFEPFWKQAAALGLLVFIHPLGSTLGERVALHYLGNTIGQPLETTIGLSHLIFSGVFDRHPDLKILAAHGGGYLPGFFGRSDHSYYVRPEAAGMAKRPSDYLRQIWYDTVLHDPRLLANLIALVGTSQIVVGTDYPYDMGEYRLEALLGDIGLTPAELRQIVRGNAEHLLGL